MFSGIGGFELGIERAAQDLDITAECVGYSEIDKYAVATYERHFNHDNYGDATTINPDALPSFDLLVAGFPCQAFSIAGKRRGFDEARGTLFFDIARVLDARTPKNFILENVKGLINHKGGRLSEPSSAPLMGWGMTSSGRYSTAKTMASPNTGNACTLSAILEEHPDPKYFLPPDRVTPIQRSASQQKPQLLAHSPQADTAAATTPE